MTSCETSSARISQRAELSKDQPIGRLMATALRHKDLISLAAGFVDNTTLPVEATQTAMQRLASQPSKLRQGLQYDSSAGNEELRSNILQWTYRNWTQLDVPADRMILTAGSNQFLHLLADAIVDPGDIVIAAAPTYFVYMGTLRAAGAHVVGVEADESGMSIDGLQIQLERIEQAGEAHKLKAIYLVTDFDNPSGSCLSEERRGELLEIVKAWNAKHQRVLVISDAAYTELRYEGIDLPPLLAAEDSAGFVVEAGTFSKSFSPGVRIGWGVVPEDLVAPLLALKSGIDFGSPHFSQVLMNEVIRSGDLDRHLPVIKSAYKTKLNSMLSALDSHMKSLEAVHWRQPDGGLYVWLELPEDVDASEEGRLWQCAMEAGVLYVPGHYCYPHHGAAVKRNSIRLSFGVQDCAGIELGISRLAQAFQDATSN